MEKENFAFNMIDFRTKTNTILSEIEEKTGIKAQSLSAYEHNRKTPNIENLLKICDFYGIETNTFTEPYFCSKESISKYSEILHLLTFLYYSKTKVSFEDGKMILNINNDMYDFLKRLSINNWIDKGLVKNTCNDKYLSNSIVEQMVFDYVYKNKRY